MMQKGLVTPITLVVLMVVFTSLLAATSYMALGTLKGSAVERASYQAFLVAESALDVFPKLVRCGQSLPSAYSLAVSGGPTAWVTYVYPEGPAGAAFSGGEVTVQAVAEFAGAKARVQQTFTVSCGIAGAIPAALTSRPHIEVKGDAQVIGQDFAQATGLLTGVTQVSLTANLPLLQNLTQDGNLSLSVQDASLILPGSYVQIATGGSPKTYRVESKSGNTLTLMPLFTPRLTDVILPSAEVNLVQFGVKSYDPGTNTLTLNDARGLVLGQTVRVGDYQGTIQSLDLATGKVIVAWSGTPPSSILQGTPLVPRVLGAASSLTIRTKGNGQISHGTEENSPMVPSDPDELFKQVFSMSKDTFRALHPPVPASSFNGKLADWKLTVVQGDLNLTGANEICGQGILVVFGNLTVNGSCGQGFQGLIYVAGDYDQQGNAVLTGAVVVEGVANLQACNGNECWTQIAGTGQGGGKIVYDPLVLHRLRVASQGSAQVVAQPGSWRRL
ncbi:hypothetical protein TthSNM11_16050 [Thermus thermophilus]|uniref:hypothetical protein n=1 Tax=Thermus thermophilus TaxID=274 RepID=UPI001FCB486A|nr:hypothetical protein [Thermus thermophilus]BDG19402.1 hypothetical protein TthSNM11_16050 [Thermus thermophilus]